jgi:hypothetical protein
MYVTYLALPATFEHKVLRIGEDSRIVITANGINGLQITFKLEEAAALRDLLTRALGEAGQ